MEIHSDGTPVKKHFEMEYTCHKCGRKDLDGYFSGEFMEDIHGKHSCQIGQCIGEKIDKMSGIRKRYDRANEIECILEIGGELSEQLEDLCCDIAEEDPVNAEKTLATIEFMLERIKNTHPKAHWIRWS